MAVDRHGMKVGIGSCRVRLKEVVPLPSPKILNWWKFRPLGLLSIPSIFSQRSYHSLLAGPKIDWFLDQSHIRRRNLPARLTDISRIYELKNNPRIACMRQAHRQIVGQPVTEKGHPWKQMQEDGNVIGRNADDHTKFIYCQTKGWPYISYVYLVTRWRINTR